MYHSIHTQCYELLAHKRVEGRWSSACLSYSTGPLEERVNQLYCNQYHYKTECYRWCPTVCRKERGREEERQREMGGGRRGVEEGEEEGEGGGGGRVKATVCSI